MSSKITLQDVQESPSLTRDWLGQNHPKICAVLDKFEMELRLGRLRSSQNSNRQAMVANVLELFKQVIGGTWWKTPADCMALVKGIGRELHQAGAGFREPAIANVVRRILTAIREEVVQLTTTTTTTTTKNSLQNMLWTLPQAPAGHGRQRSGSFRTSMEASPTTASTTAATSSSSATTSSASNRYPPSFYEIYPTLKQAIMEHIQEIQSDLEDLHKIIAEQAIQQIHAGEVILTYGKSSTVELFLTAAAEKKRHCAVLVCENAPHYDGHETAARLLQAGLTDVRVIADAAAFCFLSTHKITKVLLGAHAVLANGGLITTSGSNLVAVAAQAHQVPVVCLTAMFKLTPVYPHEDQDTLNDLAPASALVSLQERNTSTKIDWKSVEVVHPKQDYIEPKLVNLYVTNVGSFPPSYIYRLLAEYYHNDDWEAFDSS